MINIWGYDVEVVRSLNNHRAVVRLVSCDGMPFATLSLDRPDIPLQCDEFVFKTYSENQVLLELLLKEQALICVRFHGQFPICRLRVNATH